MLDFLVLSFSSLVVPFSKSAFLIDVFGALSVAASFCTKPTCCSFGGVDCCVADSWFSVMVDSGSLLVGVGEISWAGLGCSWDAYTGGGAGSGSTLGLNTVSKMKSGRFEVLPLSKWN
ncbi:hypothetical protein Tco_0294505 [Tanacetum coccineum]